jgi:peptidoglycan/xylan/chitin deacetylase (PgdA/CDA1 family)
LVFDAEEVRLDHGVAEQLRGGRIIRGGTAHRMILFTFDDGPDRRTTPRLLRELDTLGIRAVFFVTTSRVEGRGDRIRAQAELLKDIVDRGHVVGNHTADHEQLTLLDSRDARAQVVRAEEAIERIIGQRPYLFRPPYGARSARIDRILAEREYTTVLWNIGSGDFQVTDPEIVFDTWRRVLARVEREEGERGGIVLMHDTHPWTVRALPRIVDWIRRRNCELLETDEELFDIVDDPALFFQARAEDDDPSASAPSAVVPPHILHARQARVRADAEVRCRALASAE